MARSPWRRARTRSGPAHPSAYQRGTGMFGHASLPPDEPEAPDVPDALDDLPAMSRCRTPMRCPTPAISAWRSTKRRPGGVLAVPPPPQDPPTAFPSGRRSRRRPAVGGGGLAAPCRRPRAGTGTGRRTTRNSRPSPTRTRTRRRASAAAPPLRGPAVPLSEIQSDTRPSDAPPLAAPLPAELLPAESPPAESPPRETAESLTSDVLLPGKRAAPGVGWRRTIYRASGGLIRVGESAADLRRRNLVSRVRTPVAGGHHRVAVMSLKGGVGKTTAAVGLGSTLASLRGDRVIAVDGNPDRGTLSDKVRLETSATDPRPAERARPGQQVRGRQGVYLPGVQQAGDPRVRP